MGKIFAIIGLVFFAFAAPAMAQQPWGQNVDCGRIQGRAGLECYNRQGSGYHGGGGYSQGHSRSTYESFSVRRTQRGGGCFSDLTGQPAHPSYCQGGPPPQHYAGPGYQQGYQQQRGSSNGALIGALTGAIIGAAIDRHNDRPRCPQYRHCHHPNDPRSCH